MIKIFEFVKCTLLFSGKNIFMKKIKNTSVVLWRNKLLPWTLHIGIQE